MDTGVKRQRGWGSRGAGSRGSWGSWGSRGVGGRGKDIYLQLTTNN